MVTAMLVAPNAIDNVEKLAAAYTWLISERRSSSLISMLTTLAPSELTVLVHNTICMSPRALVRVASARMVSLIGVLL